MVLTGVDPNKSAELKRFVEAARPELTKTEPHGFGYFALNSDGMFGERWINVSDAFKRRNEGLEDLQRMLGSLADTVVIPNEYNSFGTVDTKLAGVTTIALHARTSTNIISMRNTHPFHIDGYALIHNGVISNQRELKNTISSCDSECILHEYIDSKVPIAIEQIQDVSDSLQGYFACAVLGNNGEYWHIDVFKDDRADLHFALIPELGVNAKVWCTCPYVLKAAMRRVKFKVPKTLKVRAHTIARLNAVTGECIETFEFKAAASEVFPFQSRFNAPETAGIPEYREEYSDRTPVDELADYENDDDGTDDVYTRIAAFVNRRH